MLRKDEEAIWQALLTQLGGFGEVITRKEEIAAKTAIPVVEKKAKPGKPPEQAASAA